MKPHTVRIPFLLGLALAFGPRPGVVSAQLVPAPVDELRRQVEAREQALDDAQVAAASARARLARAEGRTGQAVAEGRKVVAHHEERLRSVRELYARGRVCTGEPLDEAESALAIARVWLADVEGRRDILLVELPKVIAHYERRIRRDQALFCRGAITENEALESRKAVEPELRWARERLAAATADPAGPPAGIER